MIKFVLFLFSANQNIISNTDLLASLPQSSNNPSTNGMSRNLLDLNFDILGNTGNVFCLPSIIYYLQLLLFAIMIEY